MSSSLSEAIIIGALDRNDLAFWETLAAHFREKLDMMVRDIPLIDLVYFRRPELRDDG